MKKDAIKNTMVNKEDNRILVKFGQIKATTLPWNSTKADELLKVYYDGNKKQSMSAMLKLLDMCSDYNITNDFTDEDLTVKQAKEYIKNYNKIPVITCE